jgi:fructose-1-phosphate kinase PfkB-like protein
VTVNAPVLTEWDLRQLRTTLDELVDEGRLAAGVRAHTLVPVTTLKPALDELNKLLGHADESVRDRIMKCRRVVPQKRRVSLTTTKVTHARQ